MSTKVIERPSQYSFSKNEIRYKFLTDNLAPANQFVQVQLWGRLFKTKSFLNWSVNEKVAGTFVDANLLIDINGYRVLSQYYNGTGNLNLSEGDTVVITVPIFNTWPTGVTPYTKLVVKEDATELFNNYSLDESIPGWLTYTFTASANKTYTIVCYSETNEDVDKTTTLPIPTLSSYTLLKTFNLKPNADGNTYLYIDAYIDSMLKWVLPNLSYIFSNASEQTCEFYIAFREVSADTPDPAWITSESSHVRTALKGGVEKQKSSRNNYFLYQTANKSFFTWIPGNRFIFKNQPAYISALIKTPDTYKLRVDIMLIYGTSVQHDYSLSFLSGNFYHINIGYSSLDIDTLVSGDQVHYYEVSILDDTDTLIYAPHRLYVEYRAIYEYFDMIYHNSLGGLDIARIKGETTIGFEKEVQEMDGGMSVTAWNDRVKVGESIHYTTKRDIYKGNVGFVHSKAHQEALEDLIISPSIYQFIDGRFVPVLNIQRGLDLRKTSDKVFGLPIEWQLPFSNQVFTPKNIELGLGTDTETY